MGVIRYSMTKILPITDFIRKFGEYADLLPRLDMMILTREGRPFAKLSATDEAKLEVRKKYAGVFAGTTLDNDKFWKPITKRTSRKKAIKL